MVNLHPGRWLLFVGLVTGSIEPGAAPPGPAGPASDRVRSALGDGSFPWYDQRTDEVKPIRLPAPPAADRGFEVATGGGLAWAWGDYLVFGAFVATLLVLGGITVRYWKRFEPTAADGSIGATRSAAASGAGDVLPPGLRREAATADPWTEANRRRQAGDLAGAVLCLFAHQLLTLSSLGLVRLAPGRTGRQLHRSIADREFQALMAPTLRQFEAVYYGHRTPTAADFAAVWAAAEAFERRAAEQVPA